MIVRCEGARVGLRSFVVIADGEAGAKREIDHAAALRYGIIETALRKDRP